MTILDEAIIQNLLLAIAKQESLSNCEYHIDKGADKGDGYISEMTMVQLTSKEDNTRKLNLVIKCSPKDPNQRKTFPTTELYLREIRFYEEIMPVFDKFQMAKQIRDPFKCIPKYYNSYVTKNKELLIMENIKSNGFELWNRHMPLAEDHLMLAYKNYAKFHAISFAMKQQQPELYAKLSQGLNNLFVPKYVDRSFFESFELAADKAAKLFNTNNDKEKVYADRIKANIPKIIEFFHLMGKTEWETAVITHGDNWLNNFMFKYKTEENRKVLLDMKMMDFQITREMSPVLDIAYFIYMNTDVSLYNNYEQYLKYYYKCLIDQGNELGTDISTLYSLEDAKSDWKQYCVYGLYLGLIGVGILLQDKNEIVDLSDISNGQITAANVFFVDNNSKEGIRRMRNLVIHFVDNNFI